MSGGNSAGSTSISSSAIYEHDIAVLMREYGPTMEPIFAELAGHLPPTDVVEVREIVAGIDRRIAESRDRFGRRGS